MDSWPIWPLQLLGAVIVWLLFLLTIAIVWLLVAAYELVWRRWLE
jgi:hypothetical protein